MNDDADLIKTLGGPAAVAKLLGFELAGGTQRVSNWIRRGIPAEIKVKHPDIFLGIKPRKPRKQPTPQEA